MTGLRRRLSSFSPRRSFAGKLLAALVGTLAAVLAVALAAVRAETASQVEQAAARAAAIADTTFRSIEALQRAQLAEVASRVAGGNRVPAMLEAAMESRQVDSLLADIDYDLELSQVPRDSVLVVLTDPAGVAVGARAAGAVLSDADPAGVRALVDRMYDQGLPEIRSYRVVNGRLYNVHTAFLTIGDAPVGTFSLGLPMGNEAARQLGAVAGAEVCFVAQRRCLAGTPGSGAELGERLIASAADPGPLRMRNGSARWTLSSSPLDPADPSVGRRVIAVPLDPVLRPFDRISRTIEVVGLLAVVVAGVVGSLLARGLARPVRALMRATGRVARGDYDTEVSVESTDELGALARSFNEMTHGLRLKERYRGILNKVVSPDVAEELMHGGVELGGENREVTVVFADIRGFTPLTEGMEPQAVIRFLNDCMAVLSDAVDSEDGVVDKYVGDQIMAVFGAPGHQPDHAARALRTAVRMREGMRAMNAARVARGEPSIRIGVGLNTGAAVAGNMGSPERLNYTVLGDAVNLASRLCGVADPDQILATGETVSAASGARARSLGRREIKGFKAGIEVFEVEAAPPPTPALAAAARPAAPLARSIALALGLAGGLAAPASSLSAQRAEGGLPTLEDLGLWWESASGRYQGGFSGRLDLEAYHPAPGPVGLLSDRGDLVAPRMRLYLDAFAGDRLYGTVELRVDRGETPHSGRLDARIEQAFLRAGLAALPVRLQVGKFASPFGAYAGRHHSPADWLIRPPLPYDQRTVVSTSITPPDATGFLTWKDRPETFRSGGAPIVWNVPYQWGAIAAIDAGPLDARVGWMNGVPSSTPDSWSWDGDRRHGVPVVGMTWTLAPALTLGGSWTRGPFLESPAPTETDRWTHRQVLWSLDASFARGPAVVRAEVIHDAWDVPSVVVDATDLSWYVEAQSDVRAGLWLAGRYGATSFGDVRASSSVEAPWDYDTRRVQIGAGYRVVRNAEIKIEWLRDHRAGPATARADLWSTQLWWAY